MNKAQLKQALEVLAKETEQSVLQVITQAQAGAVLQNDEVSLDMLCELKWDYID